MEPRFSVFTADQAAKLLQISPAKMRRLLDAGEVPHARKIGGSWRIASQGVYGLFNEPWPARKSAEGDLPGAHRT